MMGLLTTWAFLLFVLSQCACGQELELYVGPAGGKRVCPKGHYCVGEEKIMCPAGSYNDQFGQSACKPCPEGKMCPSGSVSAKAAAKVHVVKSTQVHVHSTTAKSITCLPGFYCTKKGRFPCAAGYFGTLSNNTNAGCEGLCPRGFYCPKGTKDPHANPCPYDQASPREFCPVGSASPLTIELGRYVDFTQHKEVICERGHYCDVSGIRRKCPAGRYGDVVQLSHADCSGLCQAGYFCPEGSVRKNERVCGSARHICPEGSPVPVLVDRGYYSVENRTMQLICPVGEFCIRGVRFPCPHGTYNPDQSGLHAVSQCTNCPEGYICYGNSIKNCGHTGLYCPEKDPFNPLSCPPGYFTVNRKTKFISTRTQCDYSEGACDMYPYLALHFPGPTVVEGEANRVNITKCPKGHYCIDGERYECRPGLFGETLGQTNESCTGVCAPGFYCPATSTYSTQFECTPGHFCPQGSGAPHPVREGYYISKQKDSEILCEPGFYCDKMGLKHPCDNGKYGDRSGLSSPECSGNCPPGHICPRGESPKKDLFPCVRTDQYCPIASSQPKDVWEGYYTNEERSWQYQCEKGHYCVNGVRYICPAGTYGDRAGLASAECSGKCPKGYFCPQGTVKPETYACSDAFGPNVNGEAFYDNNLEDLTCLVYLLSVYPEQFFEFSLLKDRQERDTSEWNLAYEKKGMYNIFNTMEWDPELRGFRSRGKNKDEYMATGWRPGHGAKTMCMWKMFKTDATFGLDGLQRKEGDNDYFMIGTYWSHKDRIWVSSGDHRGGYSDLEIPIVKDEWVFYCLSSGGKDSSSEAYIATPHQPLVKVWEQDDNGKDVGILPPRTHISMIYGTTNTGTTDRPLYHTPGRHAFSDAVYGGILHWNAHLTFEELQNAHEITSYFYPQDNSRNPKKIICGAYLSNEWQQGFKARHIGPVPSIHYEKDIKGFYHAKQSPVLQLQKKDFEFPLVPQMLENGPEMLYCPEGSSLPQFVDQGYFTREHSQYVCPKGHFCKEGIQKRCPVGTYGDSEGLFDHRCSGYCPAGHECPEGTIAPIPCKQHHYAPRGNGKCLPCPTSNSRCTTSRECCGVDLNFNFSPS